MSAEQERKFAIADGLILIAGLAAGLGFIRATAPEVSAHDIWKGLAHPPGGWSWWYAFAIILELSSVFAIPFMAVCTPACLLVQIMKPRPRWRRLRRQPGFIACLIATIVAVIAIPVASTCVWLSIWNVSGRYDRLVVMNILGGLLTGSGVLWGWMVMWICGVYRPQPTWADRLGRLTGAAWIVLGASSAAYGFFLT